MIENIIIVLVGVACGNLDYYTETFPEYTFTCAGTNSAIMAYHDYKFLNSWGYKLLFVVWWIDDMPKADNNGLYAGYYYVQRGYGFTIANNEVIQHELEHVECECDHHPEHKGESL